MAGRPDILAVIRPQHVLIGTEPAVGQEEPHSVPHDRATQLQLHLPEVLHAVRAGDAERAQPVVKIGALPRRGRDGIESSAMEGVAALGRNLVYPHAPGFQLGRVRRVVERDFLIGRLRHIGTRRILPVHRLHVQAVHRDVLIAGATAVNRQRKVALPRLPADVLRLVVGRAPCRDPRDQYAQALK